MTAYGAVIELTSRTVTIASHEGGREALLAPCRGFARRARGGGILCRTLMGVMMGQVVIEEALEVVERTFTVLCALDALGAGLHSRCCC